MKKKTLKQLSDDEQQDAVRYPMRTSGYTSKAELFISKRWPPTELDWYCEIYQHRDGRMVRYIRGVVQFVPGETTTDFILEVGWCNWCSGPIMRESCRTKSYVWASSSPVFVEGGVKKCATCEPIYKQRLALQEKIWKLQDQIERLVPK